MTNTAPVVGNVTVARVANSTSNLTITATAEDADGDSLTYTLLRGDTADNIKGQPVNTWYYYNKVIKKNETARFMDSVTYNKDVDIEYDEVTTYTYADGSESTGATPEEGKIVTKTTKKYTSKENGYAGATYTLTITIQTVQYDAYESHWGVSKDTVNIAEA